MYNNVICNAHLQCNASVNRSIFILRINARHANRNDIFYGSWPASNYNVRKLLRVCFT